MWLVEIDEKITKLAKTLKRENCFHKKSLLTLRQNQCVFQSNIPDNDLKCTRKGRLYSGIKCNDKKLRSLFVNGVFKMCFNKQTKKKFGVNA